MFKNFCKGLEKNNIKKYLYLHHKYAAHREIDKIKYEEKYHNIEILISCGSL